MCVLLITRLLRGVGRWARKPVNHTSWVAVVTPTDHPKSVRNRCLIELFVALFVLSLCPFDISVGVGAFVIGLGQISSFWSLYQSVTFYRPMRGFHGTFATGVACWQGTLTPPDTWSRPIWDLHMFYLLRPILFPNLYFFPDFSLRTTKVLSRFCSVHISNQS